MSAFVTHAETRSPQGFGDAFIPRADQSKFHSRFAVAEGRGTRGFPTVRDLTSHGLPVGTQGRHSLKFDVFEDDKGKPNVIEYDGLVLHEVVCSQEDNARRHAAEAEESRIQVEGRVADSAPHREAFTREGVADYTLNEK